MVTEEKRRTVEEFEDLLGTHQVIGVVDMEGIPAAQLQEIRKELRGEATLKMGKNTLIRIALGDSGLEDVGEIVQGPTALLFTNTGPFKLYRKLEENKTRAPASAGSVAPRDIVVDKGETGLAPGPVVGDLQQAGIPAAIEGGGVVVRNEVTVAEEGEVIDDKLADALNKLGMKPMEVGLTLRGVYEDGSVYEPETLDIDVEEYVADIEAAASRAFALATGASYPTPETLPMLIARAFEGGRSLALQGGIISGDVIEDLLARVDSEAASIASRLWDDDLKEGELGEGSTKGGGGANKKEKPGPEQEKPINEEEGEGAKGDAAEGLGSLFD